MAIPMLDFNSEGNYEKTIEKILEFERTRLTTIEKKIEKTKKQKDALRDIKQQLILVGDNAKKLYGIYSIFRNFKVTSSNSENIEATIKNPNLLNKELNLKVKQLASKHTLSSKEIEKEKNLPPSRIVFLFEKEKHAFYFKGGTLNDLVLAMERDAEIRKNLTAHFIHKDENNNILVLSSTKAGKKNKIRIADDTGNLFTNILGFFQQKSAIIKNLVSPEEILAHLKETGNEDVWNGEYLNLSPGQQRNIPLKKEFSINKVKSIFFPITRQKIEAIKTLEGEDKNPQNNGVVSSEVTEKEENPFLVGILRYKIKLDEENWSEWLEKKIDSSSISSSGNAVITASSLDMEGQNKTVNLGKLSLINESKNFLHSIGTPKIIFRREENDRYSNKDALSKGQNAIFEYEGIELEREANIVDNLIDGASFILKKVSDDPIKLKSNYDENAILNHFIDFIQSYNQAVEYINIVTTRDKESLALDKKKLDEKWEERIAIFNGDYDFYRIKESLRNLVGRIYVSKKDDLKLMVELGVNRIFKIESPYDIDSDKLDMKIGKFRDGLKKYETGMQRILAYDSDQDGIIDNGFAYLLNEKIKNYTNNKSFLTQKNKSLNEEIASMNKETKAEKTRLDERKKKLTIDFNKVRQAMEKQKNLGQWMDGLQQGKR